MVYGVAGGARTGDASGNGENLQLIDGANYTLDIRGERVAIVVRFKETSFTSYRKYFLGRVPEITIGRNDDNIIKYSYRYEGNDYIGRYMAVIRHEGGNAVLIDRKSVNGIYVNDRRVVESHLLRFGDHIQIWGLDIVYLGNILAIREEETLVVNTSVLVLCTPVSSGKSAAESGRQSFHR